MVLGCKKDLVDKNRASYIKVNTKVMNELKRLDADKMVQYSETGINLKSPDDIKLFVQTTFREDNL